MFANPLATNRLSSRGLDDSHDNDESEGTIETFQTERLTAECLQGVHIIEYRRLFQNPLVMATLSADGRPLSDNETARWAFLIRKQWTEHGYGFWIFRTKNDGEFVGRAGLKDVQIEGQDEIELAYALLPYYWGQGFATEIARSIVELAFEHYGMQELICYTLTTNRASRRVMEKAGFRYQKDITHAGLPHVLYRLHAKEFMAQSKLKEG